MDVDSPAENDQANVVPTFGESQIEELTLNERRISRLLHLAGKTMAALHPDTDSFAEPVESTSGNTESKVWDSASADQANASVNQLAAEYFSTLNEVQLSLRTAIAQLQNHRISLLSLMTSISLITGTGSTIGPGGLRLRSINVGEESLPELGLGAAKLEKKAWQDITAALCDLRDAK